MGTWLQAVPQRALMGVVHGYRLLFKAWLGSACRFEPSCSAYALQALQQHGAAKGAALAAGRLMRCHPYCAGGCDPVPQSFQSPFQNRFQNQSAGLFSRLGLARAEPNPHIPADRPPIRNLP